MKTIATQSLPAGHTNVILIFVFWLCILPFLAFYGSAGFAPLADYLSNILPHAEQTPINMILALPFIPFFFAASFIFSDAAIYIFVSLAGFVLVIAGLTQKTFSKPMKGLFLMGALAIIAFPFVFRYKPALTAGPGYTTIVVTQPDFLGGVVKAAQTASEKKPCQYEISGWQNELLYYTASCGTKTTIIEYNAQYDVTHWVSTLPDSLISTPMPKNQVLDIVRAKGVVPEKYEAVTRPILLKSEGFDSTNGQWVAIVSQHIYGPQDIVILTQSK